MKRHTLFAILSTALLLGCVHEIEKEVKDLAINVLTEKTNSCFIVTGWQQTIGVGPAPIGDQAVLSNQVDCRSASNYNWWLKVIDQNVWLLVPKSMENFSEYQHFSYLDGSTVVNLVAGTYFSPLLVRTNSALPPTITVDIYPTTNIPSGAQRILAQSGCPAAADPTQCMFID